MVVTRSMARPNTLRRSYVEERPPPKKKSRKRNAKDWEAILEVNRKAEEAERRKAQAAAAAAAKKKKSPKRITTASDPSVKRKRGRPLKAVQPSTSTPASSSKTRPREAVQPPASSSTTRPREAVQPPASTSKTRPGVATRKQPTTTDDYSTMPILFPEVILIEDVRSMSLPVQRPSTQNQGTTQLDLDTSHIIPPEKFEPQVIIENNTGHSQTGIIPIPAGANNHLHTTIPRVPNYEMEVEVDGSSIPVPVYEIYYTPEEPGNEHIEENLPHVQSDSHTSGYISTDTEANGNSPPSRDPNQENCHPNCSHFSSQAEEILNSIDKIRLNINEWEHADKCRDACNNLIHAVLEDLPNEVLTETYEDACQRRMKKMKEEVAP